MATYDDWMLVYSRVYDSIPEDPSIACPNCGHQTLRLVFTADPDRMVGYAHFWCDTCLHGIGISRTHVPDGAVVQDIRLPREARSPKVPNFDLVE